MSNHDDMAYEETEDRFYAQFDSREVELMTLDGLQAAFEAGRIHENTFVCREGDDQWLTLAEVAGLGEEPEPEPVVANRRPPMPERRPDVVETRPPMPERRPAMNTVPAQRFQNTMTPVVSSTPLSFAPVSSNIDFDAMDFDELALRPKRRWGRVLFAAAALALIGGGAAFALGGGARSLGLTVPSMAALESAGNKTQASLTMDAIQTKPAEPVAAAPVAPSPAPVAAAAPSDAPTPTPAADAPSTAPGLSDDMKQALLAQDKVHQTKHAAKVKARAASAGASVAHHGKAASVGGGFKTGGSAYDPLNGKL